MIHYALRCDAGHAFDGWFPGSAAFDAQCAAGQIECPSCGSHGVGRGLMAPALGRGKTEVLPPERPKPRAPPAELMAALQRVREAVEKTCEYVGPDFADQARQMHRGEIETRGIYGETSDDQADALREEGVRVSRVPWVPRADG